MTDAILASSSSNIHEQGQAMSVEDIREKAEKAGFTIPGWAIWACGVALVPWGTWVTMSLATIQAKSDLVEQNGTRITALETNHAQIVAAMKVVEATRFTAADGRELTKVVEERLDRLEVKFDLMRRDLDRAGVGKEKP